MNLLMALMTLFLPGRRRGVRRPRTRLFLEALEDRATPASLNWIGPQDGLWHNPSHWLEGVVAGPNDTANFGVGGNPNTGPLIIANAEARIISFGSGYSATFTIRNARLSLGESFLGGDGTQVGVLIEDTAVDGLSAGISAADWIFISGSLTTVSPTGNPIAISATRLFLQSGATWTIGDENGGGTTSFSGQLDQSGTIGLNIDTTFSLPTGGWQMEMGSSTSLDDNATISYGASNPAFIAGVLSFGEDASFICSPAVPYVKLITNGVFVVNSDCNFVGTLDNGSGTIRFTSDDTQLGITGDYVQFLGTLEVRVNSNGDNSRINVSGNVTLHQTLRVTAIGALEAGMTFDIIEARGQVTGNFTTFELPQPPPGSSWITGWVPDPVTGRQLYRLEVSA